MFSRNELQTYFSMDWYLLDLNKKIKFQSYSTFRFYVFNLI